MSWQDIEQLIPFVKPFFDGARSAKEFFKREKSSHSIDIPRKTLILLPDIHPHWLRWSIAQWSGKDIMHIVGSLQATNTSNYNIRAAGLKLLQPKRMDLLTHTLCVEDADSGMYSPDCLIPMRSIGKISFSFMVAPVTAKVGKPLTAVVAIMDQFGNEHVVRNLHFKYVGPSGGDSSGAAKK